LKEGGMSFSLKRAASNYWRYWIPITWELTPTRLLIRLFFEITASEEVTIRPSHEEKVTLLKYIGKNTNLYPDTFLNTFFSCLSIHSKHSEDLLNNAKFIIYFNFNNYFKKSII
jgi:hypothetical protein